MIAPLPAPPPRFGVWSLGTVRSEVICVDCHKAIPRGTPAWRSNSNGSGSNGRRLCPACAPGRYAARRTA